LCFVFVRTFASGYNLPSILLHEDMISSCLFVFLSSCLLVFLTSLHTIVYHCTRLYTIAHDCTRLHTIAHHCTRLYTIAHHCTPLHTIAHHCTPLHTIAHHCIPLHTIAYPFPTSSPISLVTENGCQGSASDIRTRTSLYHHVYARPRVRM